MDGPTLGALSLLLLLEGGDVAPAFAYSVPAGVGPGHKWTFEADGFAGWSLRPGTITGPFTASAGAEGPVASRAAVQLTPFATGPEPLILTPGEDDLALLVPMDEPLSAGDPPLTPALVQRMSIDLAARVVESRAGYTGTCALETAPRAKYSVLWRGLKRTERDAVRAFLRDVVQHQRYGFTLEPDGPGSGIVVVRPLAPARDSWQTRAAYDITVECEEVF